MAYDPDKDECVGTVGDVEVGDMTLRVSLWSYGGGPTKVGVTRVFSKKNGNEGVRPIGRMTKEELEAVAPLLQDALDQM